MGKGELAFKADAPEPFQVPKPTDLLPENLPPYAFIVGVDRGPRRQVVKIPGVERETNTVGHLLGILREPHGSFPFSHYPEGQKAPTNWFRAVGGEICDDSRRYFDAGLIYPRTKEQLDKGRDKVIELRNAPPPYRILGLGRRAKNCVSALISVMEAVDLKVPLLWKVIPAPIVVDMTITVMAFKRRMGQASLLRMQKIMPKPILVNMTIGAMALSAHNRPWLHERVREDMRGQASHAAIPITAQETRAMFEAKFSMPPGMNGPGA